MQVFSAGHPVPDERGVRAAGQIMDLLGDAGERDLVLFLISGGGSALLTSPATGLTLEDLQRLTSLLLRCGASINEINTLRKHLEQAKAGNLARLAYPARTATLVLSDVIGNPLDVIASGPTSPDPTTYQNAWDVLARYDLLALPVVDVENRLLGVVTVDDVVDVLVEEATEDIQRECPKAKVIVLTMHDDEAYLRMARLAGAVGFVLKKSLATELIQAIRAVQAGKTYFPVSDEAMPIFRHCLMTSSMGSSSSSSVRASFRSVR